MKCPLARVSVGWRGNEEVIEHPDCLKEECAWFHPTTQSCEVSRIASNLSTIANFMECLGDTKTLTAADLIKQYNELSGEEQELFKGLFTF